jgi:hypothetical protein
VPQLEISAASAEAVRDGAGESVGIGESVVGELMLLEVAPASLDVVQLGDVIGQPFEGEPGALGERARGQVVSLLVWIGPLSRTATRGRARSAVP